MLLDVGFDGVARLDVVVAADVETALLSVRNLLDIILVLLELSELTREDDDGVANDTYFGVTRDFALGDDTSGNGADLGDVEGLLDFSRTRDFLFDFRREHTLHGTLDLLDGIIDDGIGADVNFLLLGKSFGTARRTDLEADDDGVGGGSEHDVVFRDSTDRLMDDVDLNFRRGEFDEGVGQSLDGTVHVAFDNDVHLLEVAERDASSDFVECEVCRGSKSLFPLQLEAGAEGGNKKRCGDFTRLKNNSNCYFIAYAIIL